MLQEIMNIADLPGSTVRDLATWIPGGTPAQNPFDQWMSPTSGDNRVSGRQLLRDHEIIGQEDDWGNWLLSAAAEAGMDPFTYITLGLGGALKSGGAAALKAGGNAAAKLGKTGMASKAGGWLDNAMGPGKDFIGPSVPFTKKMADVPSQVGSAAQGMAGRASSSVGSWLDNAMGPGDDFMGPSVPFTKKVSDVASKYGPGPGTQRTASGAVAGYNAAYSPEMDQDPVANPYSADINQPSYDQLVQDHDLFSQRKRAVDAMRKFMTHVQKQRSSEMNNSDSDLMRQQLMGMVSRDLGG